jgi:hypothetical protein
MRTSLWIPVFGALVGMAMTGCGRRPNVAAVGDDSDSPAHTFGFLAQAELACRQAPKPAVIYTYWLHSRFGDVRSSVKAELTSTKGWDVIENASLSPDQPGAIVVCVRKDAPKGSPNFVSVLTGKFSPYDPTSGEPPPDNAGGVLDHDLAWTTVTVVVSTAPRT